jgi:hypothetical protein
MASLSINMPKYDFFPVSPFVKTVKLAFCRPLWLNIVLRTPWTSHGPSFVTPRELVHDNQ